MEKTIYDAAPLKIESIYTNTFHKKKRYFMYVETPLFSIIEISKKSYLLLRINAIESGYKVIECLDGNEQLVLSNTSLK